MFRKNKRSQQPLLISHINELPARSSKILKRSWAHTFREEVFLRIREERFAVLYADCPSRPNVPVNVLMGLEILKAGRGWSDEELYEHFLFDLQVRYALGCDNFGEDDFDLRTLYYFRQALSRYALEKGIHLVQLTFADITDQQLKQLEVKTGMQRMDSTDIASNIADLSRLQLLVSLLQRMYRMLDEIDQKRYQDEFAPFLKEGAGQYAYRIKGKEATWEHIQQVGNTLYPLLQQLKAGYEHDPLYAIAQRFFDENFKLVQEQVQAKSNEEISPGCLQSLDDLEASYRIKANQAHKGYVTNVSETADPANPVQLVTQVRVAPNRISDQELLTQDIPAIQARMELDHLVTDAGYVGPKVDQALREGKVEQITTALIGEAPDRSEGQWVMADFDMPLDASGNVITAACPVGQVATIRRAASGQSCRLYFDPATCLVCPFFTAKKCPVRTNKKQTLFSIPMPKERAASSQRRRHFEQNKTEARTLRPAVEATMFQLTHKLRNGKVLVRGLFRVTYVVLCATLALNLRRIDRYHKGEQRGKFTRRPHQTGDSLPVFLLFQAFWHVLWRPFSLLRPFLVC
jgi:Transposase DDE domain/Transposase domain (DUF772)